MDIGQTLQIALTSMLAKAIGTGRVDVAAAENYLSSMQLWVNKQEEVDLREKTSTIDIRKPHKHQFSLVRA